MQGLIVRGYGGLPCAQFHLLRITDRVAARRYLRKLDVTPAEKPESAREIALHVAFTAEGLKALELPAEVYATFSREFLDGMDEETHSKSLGDVLENAPGAWRWGHAQDARVHVLLMVYAISDERLAAELRRQEAAYGGGLRLIPNGRQETRQIPAQKEHFGFRDGISSPPVAEFGGRKEVEFWTDPIAPGEFVLGYRNEHHTYSESPTVSLSAPGASELPPTVENVSYPAHPAADLGKNGTYLVFRELEQDVPGFWRYMAEKSREAGVAPITLASKMVGRWPNGAPLATHPHGSTAESSNENSFLYAEKDPDGLACPIGSHIRRASPRDQLGAGRSVEQSVQMVRKHQMLRRGRTFGHRYEQSMDPREVLAKAVPTEDQRRGLHFICLVSHIGRQFEFVQRAWIQSPVFGTLYKDGDPVIGGRRKYPDPNINDEFTVPAEPVRRKYKHMPQFTTLVGGAYFFMPGLKALQYIVREPGA
jgi:Dyp-type peroxidase family